MSTLLLRLAGPMQSWGSSSRFTRRMTDQAPTKSGVIGMLAAAQGRRRTDPLEELLSLRFGVRIDQPGRIERDFQTARPERGKPMPLTDRFYLTDAVFVAGVEGESSLIEGLADAVQHPQFPLYLGRRSCPPIGPAPNVLNESKPNVMSPRGPIYLAESDAELWTSLTDFAETPWQAALWWRKEQSRSYSMEFRLDADAVPKVERSRNYTTEFTQRDNPISFDPEFRQYGTRSVVQLFRTIENANGRSSAHDPMALLGGA